MCFYSPIATASPRRRHALGLHFDRAPVAEFPAPAVRGVLQPERHFLTGERGEVHGHGLPGVGAFAGDGLLQERLAVDEDAEFPVTFLVRGDAELQRGLLAGGDGQLSERGAGHAPAGVGQHLVRRRLPAHPH